MSHETLPPEVVDLPLQFIVAEFNKVGLSKTPTASRAFVSSLLQKAKRHLELGTNYSDKQEYWLRLHYANALGLLEEKKPEPHVLDVDFGGVYALLNTAKQHLKYPAITLDTDEGVIKVYLSGSNSKSPNTVNITNGEAYGYPNSRWYGRVYPDGKWEPNGKLEDKELDRVAKVLTMLGADPAGYAAKYGALTGKCCFCNTPLSNEKSTAAGFGETCAKHFGLHEQWKAAKSVFHSDEETKYAA